MKFRMVVTNWNAQIEPEPAIAPHKDYDGRVLYLDGEAVYGDHEGARCSITFQPVIDPIAKKEDACGRANWWKAGDTHFFRATVGLPRHLWEELWRRSAAPPPNTTIYLGLLQQDPSAREALVRGPVVHLFSETPSGGESDTQSRPEASVG